MLPELQIRGSNSTPTHPKLHVSKDDPSFTLYLLQPTPALAPLRHRTWWHLNSSPLAAMHPAREDTSHITAHAPLPPSTITTTVQNPHQNSVPCRLHALHLHLLPLLTHLDSEDGLCLKCNYMPVSCQYPQLLPVVLRDGGGLI